MVMVNCDVDNYSTDNWGPYSLIQAESAQQKASEKFEAISEEAKKG